MTSEKKSVEGNKGQNLQGGGGGATEGGNTNNTYKKWEGGADEGGRSRRGGRGGSVGRGGGGGRNRSRNSSNNSQNEVRVVKVSVVQDYYSENKPNPTDFIGLMLIIRGIIILDLTKLSNIDLFKLLVLKETSRWVI